MSVVGIEPNIIDKLLRQMSGQTYQGADEKGAMHDLPYALPEITFDPTAHPRYIALSVAMNNHGFQSLNSDVERMGIFQAMVVYPKSQGIIAPVSVAAAIAAAWKGVTLFGTGVKIVIDPAPYVGSPNSDATRVSTPVNIPWKAYAR